MSGEVETVGQTETPPPDDSSNGQPPSSSSHEPGPPAPPGDQPSEGATSADQPAPPGDQPSADQPAPPGDQPPHPTYSSTTLGLSEPTSDDPPSSQEDLNPLGLFMSYDNSVTYLEATRFKEYKFLQITDVESVIRQIPEESPYIDIVAFDEEPLPKGRPLTKKELSKLNKEAKLLNITNNRKAKNIAKYILDNFDRTLVDTLDPDTANCLFKAVLVQLSNVRFMFNETQQYTAQNLRLQVVYFMAINYEFMYPKVKYQITGSYKQWLMNMLDPQTEGDTAALLGCRHLLKVSK